MQVCSLHVAVPGDPRVACIIGRTGVRSDVILKASATMAARLLSQVSATFGLRDLTMDGNGVTSHVEAHICRIHTQNVDFVNGNSYKAGYGGGSMYLDSTNVFLSQTRFMYNNQTWDPPAGPQGPEGGGAIVLAGKTVKTISLDGVSGAADLEPRVLADVQHTHEHVLTPQAVGKPLLQQYPKENPTSHCHVVVAWHRLSSSRTMPGPDQEELSSVGTAGSTSKWWGPPRRHSLATQLGGAVVRWPSTPVIPPFRRPWL